MASTLSCWIKGRPKPSLLFSFESFNEVGEVNCEGINVDEDDDDDDDLNLSLHHRIVSITNQIKPIEQIIKTEQSPGNPASLLEEPPEKIEDLQNEVGIYLFQMYFFV